MKLELYYQPGCGYCRSVLNTIKNLKIEAKVHLKNVQESTVYERELVTELGDTQVPTLFVDGIPMRESEDIKKFLFQTFA